MTKMATAAETCDEHRATAGFDKFEFRDSEIIVGCKCVRNDGMQHECRRIKCMGRPECMAYPWPKCLPSQPCPPQGPPDARKRTVLPSPNAGATGRPDEFTSAADDQSGVRKRRAAARRMLRWAMAQYDDRPAFKTLFVPCRYHAAAKKAPTKIGCKTRPTADDAKTEPDRARNNDALKR